MIVERTFQTPLPALHERKHAFSFVDIHVCTPNLTAALDRESMRLGLQVAHVATHDLERVSHVRELMTATVLASSLVFVGGLVEGHTKL